MRKLIVLALCACGGASVETPDAGVEVLPQGHYWVGVRSDAGCSWLKDDTGMRLDVDDHGAVVSPLKDLGVSCVTRYDPFSVTCAGLGARVDLSGRLWHRDGAWDALGVGVASGNGCDAARFDWWAVQTD